MFNKIWSHGHWRLPSILYSSPFTRGTNQTCHGRSSHEGKLHMINQASVWSWLQRGAADQMPVVFLPETSDVECVADNRYLGKLALRIFSFFADSLQLGKNAIRIWNMRSPPEKPYLAWGVVTFFSDFRHLSWVYFLCKWAKILICWCQSLGE